MRRHSPFLGLHLLAGLPGVAVAIGLLWSIEVEATIRWLVAVALVVFWLGLSLLARERARYRLRSLSSLLLALREGDYSFRLRGSHNDEAFGQVVRELNALAEELRQQRVGDLEATALLHKVMAEIDVAVLAFDGTGRLRLANPRAEELLGQAATFAIGQPAAELGLERCLTGPPARTITLDQRRWEMRRGVFREQGRPHHLVVLSDVSRALRAEELDAFKRLIRVMGHELNNSLAPIKSLAGSLERLVSSDPLPHDWRSDLGRGLQVVSSRAESLNRFMGAYSKLARMPEPRPRPVDLGDLVGRVAALEARVPITVHEGPAATLHADPDQLEQLLINLIRNAGDASLDTGGGVTVTWQVDRNHVDLRVVDGGPGVSDTDNLFVPFFTTRSEGSGIGLFLCRQIAEAHGGQVTLCNRADAPGCEAHLVLPLEGSAG